MTMTELIIELNGALETREKNAYMHGIHIDSWKVLDWQLGREH